MVMELTLNRILRVMLGTMAAVALGLATPAGHAAPNDAGVGSPGASSSPTTGDLTPPLLAVPSGETSTNEAPAEMPPAEMASPLKTTDTNHDRSNQLEQIARQVDRQTRHGFDLAERGAYLAARSEFFGALKILADGLDTDRKTDIHGRALTAALTAMKEAEDFLPGQSHVETAEDLARVIAMHTTPVLKGETSNATSMTALKSYFTYAQEQFAQVTGDEVAGSMTLYALGKLHNVMGQKRSGRVPGAESKAMVYYQAALLAYPNNFMASNDLGVLLAQCGNYTDARTMLEHSLSLNQQSTTWHNLAVVYAQLGEPALAQRADQQAAAIRQAEMSRRKMTLGTVNNSVVWVDPQSFAETSSNTPNSPGAIAPSQPPPAPTAVPGRTSSPVHTAQGSQAPTSAERMSWGTRSYNR
jgi:tetratricopeptide (TPR) repeat protein